MEATTKKTNMQQLTSFKTSWGSQISPYIQQNVIKRIKAKDQLNAIIEEELKDILDRHSDQYDEAHEIYSHCENLIN